MIGRSERIVNCTLRIAASRARLAPMSRPKAMKDFDRDDWS